MKLNQQVAEALATLAPNDLAAHVGEDVAVLDRLPEREALEAVGQAVEGMAGAQAVSQILAQEADYIASRMAALQSAIAEGVEDAATRDRALEALREQAAKLGVKLPELQAAPQESESDDAEPVEQPEPAANEAEPEGDTEPAADAETQESLTPDAVQALVDDVTEFATAVAQEAQRIGAPEPVRDRVRTALKPRIGRDIRGAEAISTAVREAFDADLQQAKSWNLGNRRLRVAESEPEQNTTSDDRHEAELAAL